MSGVAEWDGTDWSRFGDSSVGNLFANAGELYGTFGSGIPTTVVRWNPVTQKWMALGVLPAGAMITALGAYNGELIAGGRIKDKILSKYE